MATIRGSESGRCSRFLVLKLAGKEPKPLSSKLLLAMQDSSMQEELIVRVLQERGLKITDRQRDINIKFGRLSVTGHIDGIVDGERLLEMKALSCFTYPEARSKPLKAFSTPYYLQVQTYMHGLLEQNIPAFGCLFVIKNKNTGELHEQEIKYDPEALGANMDRLADVLVMSMTGELPPEECVFGHKDYLYCPFNEHCHSQQEKPVITEAALYDAADMWRQAKVLGAQADELEEEAKGQFLAYMEPRALMGMNLVGLRIARNVRQRKSFQETVLRKWLNEQQLNEATKVSEYTEFRVIDTEK